MNFKCLQSALHLIVSLTELLPNSILLHWRQVSGLSLWTQGTGAAEVQSYRKYQGEGSTENFSIFFALCHQVSCSLQHQAHSLPNLAFPNNVPEKKNSHCLSCPSLDSTPDGLWFFLHHPCTLKKWLYGSPAPTSTPCVLPLYILILSESPCSSLQASCCLCMISWLLGWTFLELGGIDP